MARYSAQTDFAKDVAITLMGAGVGVVADKIVGDMLLATGIPNPQVATVQAHDVALVATELVGAYYAKKKRKEQASKFLVGMATAIVVTDVYEVVSASGRWLQQGVSMTAPYPMASATYSSTGKYGRNVALAPTPIRPKMVRR